MSEPFLRPRNDQGGYEAPDQRHGTYREDPLAELARLVGKDDPFGRRAGRLPASNVTQFPQLAIAPPAHLPEVPRNLGAAGEQPFDDYETPAHAEFDTELRGSLEAGQAMAPQARDSLRFPPMDAPEAEAFEPALGYPAATGRGEAPALNADLWAEGAHGQVGPIDTLYEEPAPAEPRAARRTFMVLAAVLVLTGGGLGATFLMRDGSGLHVGGGAPPTIMAASTPTKVQSPDMTDGSTQDSNTALLEKTGSDKVDNAKVVANDEQPVDLGQLPKPAATQPDAQAPQAGSPSPFPEPRKVKTVMVRPDGSIVGEQPQAAPASAGPVGMVLPAAAGGSTPDLPTATTPQASTPKATARASSTPTAPAGGASGAKQQAAPTRSIKPKPAVVADAAPAADDTPAAAPGTWSVQLAAPPSEQEAKDTSSRLQKKFAGELGGLKPSIHKADRDGKSIYRVRVGSLSQDDAKSLCSKLQASGGSCFVVRN